MKATEAAASPVRGPVNRGPSAARGPVKAGGPGPAAKRTGAGVSPGPRGSPGPGRTPQTKRRELSLTVAATDKNSPTGSPRSRGEEGRGGPGRRADTPRRRKGEEKEPEGSRKSSNSSQDSGVGRDVREAGREGVPRRPQARRPPAIRTVSPPEEREVGERQKFGELSDPSVTDIEMGIVKVPRELLEELIHKEAIEKYYTVDEVPVASGLFATVRKCKHRDTGVEYAAKYSSRVRGGYDCTTEVLHEIALLSICADSNKIVHLKDVFQNQHEIVLVLEYAPGGDFQSVLDDDMVPFEQDVQGFMLQLLEAITYIHARNIAHLDIKPQNIVLMSEFPNCEIKLCDLEVSRVIQEGEEIKEIIGTPDYVAPEILAYEPISLAADIWSLGVLAYVLLTGFSPYGGDTDQETLRNIASASLDFPAELFEGVSEEAKEFIADCLRRKPELRPTVGECMRHPWIAQHSEPPSPSPLMLKIPAPDPFVPKLSVHSPPGGPGGSRRSCQTCRDKLNPHHHHPRDKLSERKRYLSKSREAIFEKVANSNLKKSLSKSRERLCDMKSLSLSKSRDFLNESTKLASRSQEKFDKFKTISKSQEVLSPALGGSILRKVAGAVSDIPAHTLPINPRVYLDTQADSSDLVMVPGSSVLMSQSELSAISATKSSGSLQLLPIAESGPVGPLCTSACSEPCNDHPGGSMAGPLWKEQEGRREEGSQAGCPPPGPPVLLQHPPASSSPSLPLARRKSVQETSTTRTKEVKNHLNYETKQSMTRSSSVDRICRPAQGRLETAEVAIQVDLSKPSTPGAPALASSTPHPSSPPPPPLPPSIPVEGNLRPGPGAARLTRGFSHDDTLGGDEKRYSWREELEKFRATRRPLGGVSHLIESFSSGGASLAASRDCLAARKSSLAELPGTELGGLKAGRRGSLQIQIDSLAMAQLAETADQSERARTAAAKLQRRKSTSALPTHPPPPEQLPGIAEAAPPARTDLKNGGAQGEHSENANTDKHDPEKAVSENEEEENGEDDEEPDGIEKALINGSAGVAHQSSARGRAAYLEKVNERKRTWDYFEINHPKAISDKKLEQLKEKYTRRKTEASLVLQSKEKEDKVGGECKSSREGRSEKEGRGEKKGRPVPPPASRTVSMPVIQVSPGQRKKSLELAWDPLTGQSLGQGGEGEGGGEGGGEGREEGGGEGGGGEGGESQDTESVDSGRESEGRKVSSSSTSEESGSSRKSSRRKSSHLTDILELADRIIPEQCYVECFIDPFTGQFMTSEVTKSADNNKRNLRVSVCAADTEEEGAKDEGVGSLPCTVPTTPTTTTSPLSLPSGDRGEEEEEEESVASCCPTDDGICTSGSEGRVRGSELSLASGEEEDGLACLGPVVRGIERFQGESGEM